jgi:DNA-directed RNA polymerase specialized sigma24 family protein
MPVDEPGSITQWLQQLQSGDKKSATEIWKRFYPKIVRLASRALRPSPDRSQGGEDIAQSAVWNVFEGIIAGNYPYLENRNELWNLLFIATMNRVRTHFRELKNQKNPALAFEPLDDDDDCIRDLSSPQAEIQMADLLEFLMKLLDQEDPTGNLRSVACLHLEEHSANEIARILRRRKTVVLQQIRMVRILWGESGAL